jgi:hypothetical protein
MTSPLLPTLNGRTLTVDVALKQPTIIAARIAKLADKQLLLGKVLRPLGAPIQGGALEYSLLTAASFLAAGDVEKRAPGAEYRVVDGISPTPALAPVEDWGAKAVIPVEAVIRNSTTLLDNTVTQMTNTLLRKLDTKTVAALQSSAIASFAPSNGWSGLTFVGPLTDITPSANRPTRHFAEVQAMADFEEMGITHDLLIVNPDQARQLRTAYAENLDDMLASAGFTNGMFVNPRVPSGVAFAVEQGAVGTVGFEVPLTVDTWLDKDTRSWKIQVYAVPAMAVDRPFAAKKIAGLS